MTSRTLHLAKDLSFPLDAVTQTFLIVGKRGSGKSNTAARFVEQLHRARLPFVVLDPVDTWWGLKAGREGGEGLGVYVFGGRHADLPLEAGGGALIADVLCEHRMPMVLSVKHLSGRERSDFMVAFAKTLFQKWVGGPLHVVLEEAHELAPQNTQNAKEGEQQMLGAFKRLWKLGRSSGIGGTAVTQRPASLSKDITTQSEILIAHRTIGPQDVKAIGEWVKYHGERLDILAELPSLPTGEAFVWAPEFPEGKPIGLQRTSILLRDTYDSASTPKVGEQRVEPKELAAVDLERLRTKMAATIEKAKADDPRELRKQIAELKKQLAMPGKHTSDVQRPGTKPVALTDADRQLLEKVGRSIETMAETLKSAEEKLSVRMGERMAKTVDEFNASLGRVIDVPRHDFAKLLESKGLQKILDKLATVQPVHQNTHATMTQRVAGASVPPAASQGRRVAPVAATNRPASLVSPSSNGHVGGGLRRILIALAQRPQGLTLKQIGVRAALSSKSGTFSTYMSRARQEGWIQDGGKGGPSTITDAGLAALGAYEPLPTGDALLQHWLSELGGGASRILAVVAAAYPETLTLEQIGERANISHVSGTFSTYMSRLRTLELIESGRGWVRASEELFS